MQKGEQHYCSNPHHLASWECGEKAEQQHKDNACYPPPIGWCYGMDAIWKSRNMAKQVTER